MAVWEQPGEARPWPVEFCHPWDVALIPRRRLGQFIMPFMCVIVGTAVQDPGEFNKTGAPAQLRHRRESAMRGLECGSRI